MYSQTCQATYQGDKRGLIYSPCITQVPSSQTCTQLGSLVPSSSDIVSVPPGSCDSVLATAGILATPPSNDNLDTNRTGARTPPCGTPQEQEHHPVERHRSESTTLLNVTAVTAPGGCQTLYTGSEAYRPHPSADRNWQTLIRKHKNGARAPLPDNPLPLANGRRA